jgi:hypothetical protein
MVVRSEWRAFAIFLSLRLAAGTKKWLPGEEPKKEELDEGSFGTVCPSPEPSAHTVLRSKPGFGFNIFNINIGPEIGFGIPYG